MMKTWPKPLKETLIWTGLVMPLALYGGCIWYRPPQVSISERSLFQGITYSRLIKSQPRAQVLHLLEIDLSTPGLTPFSTPGIDTGLAGETTTDDFKNSVRETLAQTTSGFLQAHGLQLAVNANFFYPFEEKAPWSYGPRDGDAVSVIGVAMSDGEIVSEGHPRYSSLCFLPGRAEIVYESLCPGGSTQAVSGQSIWASDEPLPDGRKFLADQFESAKPYAVNMAGLDAEGTRLWLLLGDGKQPLYSEGTTLEEATTLLTDQGATAVVQLDGGGSTTLVIEENGWPKIVNAVVHTKLPGRERPVANHLGFFAKPLQP